MNAEARMLNLLLTMCRIAYADGFRDGAQWTHDSMDVEAQTRAFDWATSRRDNMQEQIAGGLSGEPEE